MNPSDAGRAAAKSLLLAALVAINSWPFFTSSRTSVETIFFVLSAIHAELCLFAAWGIFVEPRQRRGRIVWAVLGTAAGIVAAIRLLPGQWTAREPWHATLLGLGATLPALVPIFAIFVTQSYCSGTELRPGSPVPVISGRFRLQQMFAWIGCCALLSLMLRVAIRAPQGWFAELGGVEATLLSVVQSFVMGMIAAPCALVVLKPNRFAALWMVYFVVVVALQPLLEQVIRSIVGRSMRSAPVACVWPESYLAVVIDNVAWYGPQLLPTIVLFALLRLAGIRVQNTK